MGNISYEYDLVESELELEASTVTNPEEVDTLLEGFNTLLKGSRKVCLTIQR